MVAGSAIQRLRGQWANIWSWPVQWRWTFWPVYRVYRRWWSPPSGTLPRDVWFASKWKKEYGVTEVQHCPERLIIIVPLGQDRLGNFLESYMAQSERNEFRPECIISEWDLYGWENTLACRSNCDDCVRLSVCLSDDERSTLKRSERSPVLASMLTKPRSMETAVERVVSTNRRDTSSKEFLIYVVDIYYRYFFNQTTPHHRDITL